MTRYTTWPLHIYDYLGQMVAKYRKMHLVVIDIPGRINIREPDALTEGSELATFDTGVYMCVCVCIHCMCA